MIESFPLWRSALPEPFCLHVPHDEGVATSSWNPDSGSPAAHRHRAHNRVGAGIDNGDGIGKRIGDVDTQTVSRSGDAWSTVKSLRRTTRNGNPNSRISNVVGRI